jgi:hypothetical protein
MMMRRGRRRFTTRFKRKGVERKLYIEIFLIFDAAFDRHASYEDGKEKERKDVGIFCTLT